MSTGSLVLLNTSFTPTGRPLIDPDKAARLALAAYLVQQTYKIAPGDDGFVREFTLNEVSTSWPSAQKDLPYPCASISGPGLLGQSDFTAEGLEETRDVYGPGTFVWKLDELESEYQIDFFTTSEPEREAIAAKVPGLFMPNDGLGRVWLETPAEYLSWPMAAMYVGMQRGSNATEIYSNEYRLSVRVQVSVDVIELRCTPLLDPTPIVEVVQQPQTIQDFEGADS
jgi:hypothetical protein